MFNNKDFIRHDYVTKATLLIIKELNFNKNFKWITYNEFIKFQKKIIKDNKPNLNDKDINDFIKYLIDLDEEEEEKSIVLNNKFSSENIDNEDDLKEEEDEINCVNEINSESDINDNSISVNSAISEDDINLNLLLKKLDLGGVNGEKHNSISLLNKENDKHNSIILDDEEISSK